MFQKLNHIPSNVQIILIGNIVTQVSIVAHLYLSCLAKIQLTKADNNGIFSSR